MVLGDAKSQCDMLFAEAKKAYEEQNYAKSLEYLTQAKTIAESNDFIKKHILALNNMGLTYMQLLDYEKAMECYLEGYQLAMKDPEEYNKNLIGLLNNISLLYSITKDFAKANDYLRQAYQDAIQSQDSLRAGMCAVNLASFTNETDLEKAAEYLDIAMAMFKNKTVNPLWLLSAKGVRVENLYLKGQYNKAEQLALEMLNEEDLDTDLKGEVLLLLSKLYQQTKEYQNAIEVAKEALNNSPKLPTVIEIYEQLSKIYLGMDKPYVAIQYIDSMTIAKDSLTKITNMTNVKVNQVKIDLINSEKALAESQVKQKAERTLLFFILAFIFFSVLIAIWIFRMQSAKNKQLKYIADLELEKQTNENLLLEQDKLLLEQDKLLLEQDKLLLKQQLKEQEGISMLEQQRLNNEIDTKNRQLTAEILFQSHRNELIKEIIDMLTKIPNRSGDPILKSVISKLKKQAKESTTDWTSFLTYFEQINSSFLSALKKKHPDLSTNDIRFLSYIYLDLDTKEIARLFNIEPVSYRKKKQRISKKMNVTTEDLYKYLTNIEK